MPKRQIKGKAVISSSKLWL